jgi:glutamyl-tRNA reductase
MTVPLAVVGMDFREGPTSLRSLLKHIDDGPDSPSQRLRTSGEAAGIVRLESCSRIEWVVSASNPSWAGELLRGALLSRLGAKANGRAMHAKVSRGAVHYMVRVALGLESVAEGEHAIGRQVIKAFEAAHGNGATDRTLNLCWHALGRVLQLRKDTGASSSVGLQSLVVNELKPLSRSSRVLVLGLGDIGAQVLSALQKDGFTAAKGYRRNDQPQFDDDSLNAEAVVVCTGQPQAHLRLQPRRGVAIDLGCPAQILDAPLWERIDLDALLARRGLTLDNEVMTALQTLADQGAVALEEMFDDAAHHHVLEALESERKKFFEDDIETLVAQLPPKEARRITAQLRGFTHRLLAATRRAGRAP